MRNFTIQDFDGSGQYLVRQDGEPKPVLDTGYLSTIMYKVGYYNGHKKTKQRVCLISMSDGWIRDSHFSKDKNNPKDVSKWEEIFWESGKYHNKTGKQIFIEHINDTNTQELRFASQEEVVRVVLYQRWRWRNYNSL